MQGKGGWGLSEVGGSKDRSCTSPVFLGEEPSTSWGCLHHAQGLEAGPEPITLQKGDFFFFLSFSSEISAPWGWGGPGLT